MAANVMAVPPSISPSTEALAQFPTSYARTVRFSTGTPRNVTVTGNGSRVLFSRSRAGDDPVLCLWAIDLDPTPAASGGSRAGGSECVVVDPRELGSADAELPAAEKARRERARESASGIVAYSVDDAGSTACFALAGSLFVVDIDSGEISAPAIEGSVFDPRISPDGSAVAFVDGQSLRVVGLDPASPFDGLTLADPDPLISYGRAEFIAAEEMQRSRGYWWSPDSSRLLVTSVDENDVDQWWIAEPAHPGRAPNSIRYPAAGTSNARVALHLVTSEGDGGVVDWSDGGRFEYLANVVWQRDHEPLVVRQTRDQRLVSIAEIDATSSATLVDAPPVGSAPSPVGDGGTDRPLTVQERYQIVDEVWVELIPGSPRWCSSGLLTIEDRDGARRLVVDGKPVTDTDIQVRATVGLTTAADGTEIAIVAAWTEPTEVQLLAVALNGEARTQALTTEPGVHTAATGGNTIVISSTGPDRTETMITVNQLAVDHEVTLSERAVITDHSPNPGFVPNAIFTTLGGDDLTSALFLPEGPNGDDPLPVVVDPYGGPHAQRVLKAAKPHLVSRWLAEQGYGVLVVDGRGTPGRGPAWERTVWGNLADPVLDDQLSALDAALDRYPFLDADRVGIRGWSFGGYLAALAVLRRPDRFHAAVAGAPVTSWGLYDTHYTERYLGHPDTHPDHYRQSDLWTDGEPLNLTRPLLLIHGLADDNVVAAHTLRFSTELLASGSPHQVLPLSGVTHMTPQEAVAENLLRLQLRFFDDTIAKPQP